MTARAQGTATATRRAMGQFFTPDPVVDFVLDGLVALGLDAAPTRVVDPACGEGAFLRAAASRFPEAELWGCDLDAGLDAAWQHDDLPSARTHLLVQDGLVDAPLFGLGGGEFDLVVGNPPYGFGVPRPGGAERIEEVFMRRFVALARVGGWLGVVLPEGIAANARGQGLRDWLLDNVTLKAVVALPDATFAATGTRASTVVVLAHKGIERGGHVLLASPAADAGGGAGLHDYLSDVLDALRGKRDVSAGRIRR